MDIKKIDKFLENSTENLKVPSVAAIIVNQDKILYEGYYGVKNINTKEGKIMPVFKGNDKSKE